MGGLNRDSEFMDSYEKHLAQMEKKERVADILSIISPIGKLFSLGLTVVCIVILFVAQELIESEMALNIFDFATSVLGIVLKEFNRLTTAMAIVSLALGTKKKSYAAIALGMQGVVITIEMLLVMAFILFWVIVLLAY